MDFLGLILCDGIKKANEVSNVGVNVERNEWDKGELLSNKEKNQKV